MEAFLNKHHIQDKIIAVGVSGGADSLALVLQADHDLRVFGRRVVALTVDHGLRPTSGAEAAYVSQLMAQYGIEHHILHWTGEKPTVGIEEAARVARYDLLCRWCEAHHVHALMIAHHLRDQAETFLMRMQRGSGLEGLCCMREVSLYRGIKILRPFLHTSPEKLQNFLRCRQITWIEDESNNEDAFLRVKMRHFLPEFIKQTHISLERIDEAVSNLQSAEDFVETSVEKVWQQEVEHNFDIVHSVAYTDYLKWHREIKFRIFNRLCRKYYAPRADSVLQLINALDRLPFEGMTLGGKEILLAYQRLWIIPEIAGKHLKSREPWEKFLLQYPEYKQKKLPHKAKVAILEKMGHDL